MFPPVGRIDPMKDPDASCLSSLPGVTIASRELRTLKCSEAEPTANASPEMASQCPQCDDGVVEPEMVSEHQKRKKLLEKTPTRVRST
jgi:hypothetical protein